MRPHDVPLVQFGVLCAIPLVSAACAWRFRGRQSVKEAAASLFSVVTLWVLVMPAFLFTCGHRSNPSFQILIPLAGAALVTLVVGDRRLRFAGVGGLFAAGVCLMITYTSAVNGALYVGTTRASGVARESIVSEWHTPLTNMYRVRASVRVGCGEGPPRQPPA